MEMNPCSLWCIHPDAIDKSKVRKMAETYLYAGGYPPSWRPIEVYYFKGRYLIIDGNHRAIAACQKNGYTETKTVPVIERRDGGDFLTDEDLKKDFDKFQQVLYLT
jgi:hypothetical protein